MLRSIALVALARDAIHFHFPGYLQANAGAGTWRTTPAAAVRAGPLKMIEWFEDGRCELYDVVDDPGETHDLSAERPEDVARLRARMAAWREATGALMPSRPEDRAPR